jgi:putative ubiquitin-RnfH superfamily antitoxin RatB of RatAB toxin-antitoxin module
MSAGATRREDFVAHINARHLDEMSALIEFAADETEEVATALEAVGLTKPAEQLRVVGQQQASLAGYVAAMMWSAENPSDSVARALELLNDPQAMRKRRADEAAEQAARLGRGE